MLKTAAGFTLAISLVASSVCAEPISIVYSIHITDRCVLAQCNTFSAAFPLTMTFDSGVTSQFDSPTFHTKSYGPPSFSAVPLERPAIPPSATPLPRTLDTAAQQAAGTWEHRALADGLVRLLTPEVDHLWTLRLFASQSGVPTPELSPHTMATLLGQPANPPGSRAFFEYGYFAADPRTEQSFDSISYVGSALVADDQAPIPEPATCVLVGSGLMGAWYQKRRQMKRH